MKSRPEQVTVTLKAKVVESTRLRDPRLVLVGHAWTGAQDFCIHGTKLRWRCEWCDAFFRGRPSSSKTL